tara:strand:- start:33360 stop:38879 length:5520 start_codon:yes stop_codon:yes gene_type:complete
MAKKLLVGGYDFNAPESSINIKGNYAKEKFLLITNVEDNKIIYNFADATSGFSGCYYYSANNTTTLNLTQDCTSMSSTDHLQVFVDEASTEITPAEDLIDPVGKLRISDPQNLIDTDFEYGLQGTKWETTQQIANIPTIYSNSGDTPIDGITSAMAVTGSKAIKVTTTIPHGLNIGDPIAVNGMSNYTAEGFFIVTSVPDTLNFFFESDVASPTSGDISGSYTTITAGKFFEGSTLAVSIANGAVTDAAANSTISVTTQEVHGLAENTKVYLRNTVGPKTLTIANSIATAADGRPTVDTQELFISNLAVTSANTGRGENATIKQRPIISYDWEPTYVNYITDTTVWNNGGTWNVYWQAHGLRDKYALLFNTAYQGLTDGGLEDGVVYYVKKTDDNNFTLFSDSSLNTQVQLQTLNNIHGPARLGLVYKVESVDGTTRTTAFGVAAQTANQGVTATSWNVAGGQRLGSSSTGSIVHAVDVTAVLGGNPATLTIDQIKLAGDVDSSFEWVNITIGSTSAQVYAPGNQSSSFGSINSTTFNGLNVSSLLYVDTDGKTKFNMTTSCSSAVGTFTMFSSPGPFRYMVQIQMSTTQGSALTETQLNNSGSDFNEVGEFGLGQGKPAVLIGFQGRSPTSSFLPSEQFTYLSNQRTNGRYGTINRQYSTQVSSTSNTGNFVIDYTQGAYTPGTSSEIFYVFANVLSADRNTYYLPSHGIPDAQEVTLTANDTSWAAGQRFGFADGSGNPSQFSTQSVDATVQVINQDVIRISCNQAPNTDDIIRWPSEFYIGYQRNNPTYNTIYVENHKIQADSAANYNVGNGSAILPLVDATQYTVVRYDDNRITVKGSGGGAATTITNDTAGSNSNASNQAFFLDIETAAGFAPVGATITQIEYRGDFSWVGEYVVLTIGSTNYNIGQSGGADTGTFRTDSTWQSLTIDSLLGTQGGKIGLAISCSPTAAINFSPGGMPNGWWWQFRFTIDVAAPGTQIFTSAGTQDHTFDVINLIGAYDGVFDMESVPTPQTFTMKGSFQIPFRDYPVTSAIIDNATDIITFADPHNLITGEEVTYDSQLNTSILPAGSNNTVFAIPTGNNTVKLATSTADAEAGNPINITGQTGNHLLRSTNVIKSVRGTGNVNITNNSIIIRGTGDTSFLTNFKRYDPIYINTGTKVEKYLVNQITTANTMTLFDPVADLATSTINETDYYYISQLALRPDGFVLHKPFDGGVDMTAGTSPNSKITRQTRKYFRYQSGKGIQTSVAINFNPPRIVSELIKATGATATVKTQEQHNLAVGDTILINDAVVDSGFNYYNGTHAVATVPDPFSFTYTMAGEPGNVKAQGFPTYVRDSWTDAFVRTGMFDDQNGFFWEFDGQKLYAVRRSSTKQLAGTVNVITNSQVVTGQNCSFTTQVNANDNLVIRGQTYRVVQVSSDQKMIVQPAYRGITANAVKATLTEDVRTPQEEWSLDQADGNGFSGFLLNTKKIQMAYIDYSWYGAGKIRYGFKDNKGHIRYLHEYIHNNKLDESYFRSGNLPARYEIENGTNATTAPTLFHFGTSVIMDGRFDDDKAYQFTGQSKPFAFTQGQSRSISSTAVSEFEQITLDGSRVYVYSFQCSASDATATTVGQAVSHQDLVAGTYVSQVKVDGASSKIYLSYPSTSTDPTGGGVYDSIASGQVFVLGESNSGKNLPVDLTRPLPLVSIRLAPSVDSSLTGKLGEREVVNRMQLKLMTCSLTVNQDAELFLIQNPLPSELTFIKAQNPSLSEIIKHSSGDTLLNGTTIYSTKQSTGSASIDISSLLEMGNSILGGDGIFPAGPDLLTLAVQPQDTSGVSESAPFFAAGKISWSESQA